MYPTGVNKIPPKFDTLFATPLWVVQEFKGLPVQHLYGSLGSKRLTEKQIHNATAAHKMLSCAMFPECPCSCNWVHSSALLCWHDLEPQESKDIQDVPRGMNQTIGECSLD